MAAMTSVRVPGFLPSAVGFHFANAFPHIPLREVRLEGIATLSIGDAANGLCGGMSYTVADLFHAHLAPPADSQPPDHGPRFESIVNRQIDSFAGGSVPLRFYSLMDPSRPAREPVWAPWLGRIGIDRHSRSYVMVHEEWPPIRAELDAGRLVPMGLVRVVDRDPRQLGRNHQVLAYGYELDGSALTVRIYDPNVPGGDDVTLALDISNPMAVVMPRYSAPGPAVVCFFRAPYRAIDPVAWRSP
jgi:hypothetical protein